jgi:hypothetical protein
MLIFQRIWPQTGARKGHQINNQLEKMRSGLNRKNKESATVNSMTTQFGPV